MRFFSFIFLSLFLLTAGCAMSEANRRQASYHYQMGLSFLGEGNATRALVEFTEAERLTPNDPQLLNYLGVTYFYKKRYDLAEQKLLRAIKLRPNYSEARNYLGVNYLEMGRWDDAIAQFKVVSEDLFYQNSEVAVINMGLAYYGKGDYTAAQSLLTGVVAEHPDIPQAHVSLARVYMAMDKHNMAVSELQRALELNKDYADAYFYLGQVYLKGGNRQAASLAFRETIRLTPDSEKGQQSRQYIDQLGGAVR
ncbi:MAG TPA: tetratricopeptide repeat protein [Geobacterales bacterium]|nr:tetratricopeptide repeat protein [Geobacterales bacterium]